LPVDLVLPFKGRLCVRKLTLVADPTSSPSQELPRVSWRHKGYFGGRPCRP
jgi:hypothetical protein